MFEQHFETILADSDAARRIHYLIRYQVYCLETGFENPEAFPDRQEIDEWDKSAAHFLVRSKVTGEWVAAMRLIIRNKKPLPIESLCKLDHRTLPEGGWGNLAEVSRLCMVARYRRRASEPYSPCEIPAISRVLGSSVSTGKDRRQEPEILLGLLCAAVQYSREHDIRYWYYLGTPALSRMMRRYSIDTRQVGPICVHRGTRFPYLADLDVEAKRAASESATIARMLGRQPVYRRYSQAIEKNADGNLVKASLS